MSQPFTIVIPDDPTAGLPQYRVFLTYLKEHQDIPTASKFEIQLLLSMSCCLQTLQTTYTELFQMEETEVPKIKTMRNYIVIMLKKLVPYLPVKFEQTDDNKFTLATSGAMLEKVTSSPTVTGTPKASGTTFESNDTELDPQLEKDMMAVTDKMENDRLTGDRFQTPVRHVHTEQSKSITSSVMTKNSTYATMTGKVSKMSAPNSVTPVKQATKTEDVNSAHVTNPTDSMAQVQDDPVTKEKDQDSPIYAFENGNTINIGTFSTNQMTQSEEDMTGTEGLLQETVPKGHVSSAIPPGTGNATKVASSHGSSDGYTLVTEGVKQVKPTQSGTTKSVMSGKSSNFFKILNSEDNDEDPIEQQQDSEETHLSPILLGPHQQPKSVVLHAIRDNIATTPKTKSTNQPANQKPPTEKTTNPSIPGTYSLGDKKLREKQDGFNAIEEHLTRNNHHLASLNNLVWYITTAKPRIGHIRGQVRFECESVQQDMIRECRTACTKMVDFTSMEMSKTADAECNKLNNTSHKIFQELDNATAVMKQMTSLHDMCAAMVKLIGDNPHQFDTHAEQTQTIQKCKDSVMDMENEVTRVEAKLRGLQSNILQLRVTQNSQTDQKMGFATDPNRLQDQIDYLRQ